MIIAEHSDERGVSIAKIQQHSYRFIRADPMDSAKSCLSGHIGKGDPVSLSIEPDLILIARGFVLELTPTEVKIGTNLELDENILLERTGAFANGRAPSPTVFRIDKDEMMSGTARMRNNLAQLFYPDDANGDAKRRSLVVDLDEPAFEDVWAPDAYEIPSHLNMDQREAMRKVLTAKDYALVLGMPGTGKTTTIAEIIIALVNRGKSVLLTSYTHSAVDTILMKLINTEHKMLRLGNSDKVRRSCLRGLTGF
jgi:DNA replication ATP-dependent helicase Dna2